MTITGILFFIVAITLVIFIHEMGHLLTAKMFGVHCHEFSIGMGPKLFTIFTDKTGTKYNVRLIPLGGYVMIAGEDTDKDIDIEIPKEKQLDNKIWWKRIIVLLAGTIMNVLLCYILLVVLSIVGKMPQGFISNNEASIFVQFGIAFENLIIMFKQILDVLVQLFTTTTGINNASGLIGIADASNQIASQGIWSMIYFVAMISINIGLLNQLPLPILDGGRIIFVIIETIIRRKIPKIVENILYVIAIGLLGFIFLYTGFNDIKNLFN